MVILTWHACKYKVHKLHQKYIVKQALGFVLFQIIIFYFFIFIFLQ